jgi:capsular polysaccharide biosynthesis protein
MTEQSIQTYEENEISLLDILVTLAESWKLLMFGPLITAVLAGGLSFMWPKTFESVAIVRMTEEEVVLLHAAPVLDSLIEKFGLLAEADGVIDAARQDLKKRLTFAVDKKTKLATITAKAGTPEAAQALGSSAIVAVLKELQVKGQAKALLENFISINLRAIANAEDALDSVQRSLKRSGASDLAQESSIKNLAVINSDIAKLSKLNEELRQQLEPRGAEVYVQESSLPQDKYSPKRIKIMLIAGFLAGLTCLMFVFIRKSWRDALANATNASKLKSIKRSFGIE